MQYWWVNQNQTYKHEVGGQYMWSPRAKKDGSRNPFYDFMMKVAPGDVVFSFFDTRIAAIGKVMGPAETAPKPDFGTAGGNWADEGWLVPTEFVELSNQVRPKDHIAALREHLPSLYSPLNSEGNGSQSVYLTAVPEPLAEQLGRLIGPEFANILGELTNNPDIGAQDEEAENAIRGRTDIPATHKIQLVKARIGQGLFKSNVFLNESKCRVTGVAERRHLVASHIKPWSKSNDEEKLDGCNGLLLSPHIDHLFDRGLISFSDTGHLLVSKTLKPSVLTAWGIDPSRNVGAFNAEQRRFLADHRARHGFSP